MSKMWEVAFDTKAQALAFLDACILKADEWRDPKNPNWTLNAIIAFREGWRDHDQDEILNLINTTKSSNLEEYVDQILDADYLNSSEEVLTTGSWTDEEITDFEKAFQKVFNTSSITQLAIENKASDMLVEAADIVQGVRAQQHGDKERSFASIADMWNAYLSTRKGEDTAITAYDVAQMMVLLKMVRANQGSKVRDHYVDMAGYAGIAGEIGLGESQ